MPVFKHNSYESMSFPDPDFPIIFHFDCRNLETEFTMHWQDSPEILYFVEGEAEVTADNHREICRTGDIAFFNSGRLHSVYSRTPIIRYYCLIAERDFLERQGLPVATLPVAVRISDPMLSEVFEQIVREMLDRERFYKTAAKAYILTLIAQICRHCLDRGENRTPALDKRIEMVKIATRYMQEHFAEELSIETISAAAGFSKYYFCRGFKEITGRTVVDYLNFLRCTHAKRLLSTGRCNVSEAAERSGFRNFSYFSKIYRKYMGILPSHEEENDDFRKI
ncbi:MAG: AraC family transcriptional regulator [Candidatus Merdivicinus sp.]|jgi:AraC-like DNA-binding protein